MSSSELDSTGGAEWIRGGGLVAWPRGWQRPARTEEWAYEQYASAAHRSRFSQLLCFPWATLIDLLDRGKLKSAQRYLSALSEAPPRTTLVRATVCQHIRVDRVLPWFKLLGITDLFWTHCRLDTPAIHGIRVHPFPLYPVRCYDRAGRTADLAAGELRDEGEKERKYLYSFVGAYCPDGYLTQVRQWIFDLPSRPDGLVISRSQWHYEDDVYGRQVEGRDVKPSERHESMAFEFDAALRESTFALCPSGSGPNSIRLWEALGFGSIPVLLADTLRLPGPWEAWKDAIVRVPETREAVASLPDQLTDLAHDRERLRQMRRAGRHLWETYGERGPINVLGILTDKTWLRQVSRDRTDTI